MLASGRTTLISVIVGKFLSSLWPRIVSGVLGTFSKDLDCSLKFGYVLSILFFFIHLLSKDSSESTSKSHFVALRVFFNGD
jgi:hypothetical protein